MGIEPKTWEKSNKNLQSNQVKRTLQDYINEFEPTGRFKNAIMN